MTLEALVEYLRRERTIDPARFLALKSIAANAIKSSPSFYMKERDEDDFRDLLSETIQRFYRRAVAEGEPIRKPEQYLRRLIKSVIDASDVDLFNREYLYLRTRVVKRLEELAQKGLAAIDRRGYCAKDAARLSRPASRESAEEAKRAVAETPFAPPVCFERFDAQARERLDALIVAALDVAALDVADGALYRNELIDDIADRVGVVVYRPERYGHDDPKNEIELTLVADQASPYECHAVARSIERAIASALAERDALAKGGDRLLALWYYRVAAGYTLGRIAERLGYASPANVDYYLKKHRVEEKYYAALRDAARDCEDAERALNHAKLLFARRLEELFETHLEGQYEK